MCSGSLVHHLCRKVRTALHCTARNECTYTCCARDSCRYWRTIRTCTSMRHKR